MTIRILLTGCLSGALLMSGCSATRNNISGKAAQEECASIPLKPGEPVISWRQTVVPQQIADTLPPRSRGYIINGDQLDSFFSYSRIRGIKSSFSVPLPGTPGCQYFEVNNSGTLTEGLADKYPRLVSLKGHAIHNPGAGIRLDYDGHSMRAEITWGAAVYLVAPVPTKSGIVYIVYHKQDSREIKEPFEQKINPRMQELAAPLPIR